MLDVVFILLIFFVVTTVPFDEHSLPLVSQQLVPLQQLSEDIPDNILIEVLTDKRIVFNGDTIDIRTIRARVALIKARIPGVSVIIRPVPGSLANELVTVADALRLAGVETIRISE
jgi:biopolymer transport protein ExbD